MTTFRITAIAPTTYQLSSVRLFGSEVKSLYNGKHIFQKDFDSEEEAKSYLISRAEYYYETEEQLNEAVEGINKYGSLQLDAVNGSIEEVETEE